MNTDNDEIRRILRRIDLAEAALEKLNLRRCGITGEWFKYPDEGIMISPGLELWSWSGLAGSMEAECPMQVTTTAAHQLCERLYTHHRATLEAILRDGMAMPQPVSRVAVCLGLAYPFSEAKGHFGAWLIANQRAIRARS